MARFLFLYGYESPAEWSKNHLSDTDDESSGAVWVTASDEAEALAMGREYAERHTAKLFDHFPELSYPGWIDAGYAHWIERSPHQRFSETELDLVPEIGSNHSSG